MRRILKRQSGFSMVEMVVTIVIIGLLAVIAGPLLMVAVETFGMHTDRVHIKDMGAIALARMSRDIRRLDDRESVITATATEFRFEDVDGNDIQYAVSGTNLTRRVGSGGTVRTLASEVSGLAFVYMDEDENAIATPEAGLGTTTDIRIVEFEIDFSKGIMDLTVTGWVTPPNSMNEADLFG